MQIFKNISIDFVEKQSKALIFSAVLVIAGIVMILTQGIKMGPDFTGGVRIVIKLDKTIDLSAVRTALSKNNFLGTEVRSYGTEKVSITLKEQADEENEKLVDNISALFASEFPDYTLIGDPSVKNISGKMSKELVAGSVAAIIFALVLIALYIIVRFSSSNIVMGITGFVIDYIIFKAIG